MMGRPQALAELAAPEHDQAALEADVRMARARASRKPVSLVGEVSGNVTGGLLGELPPAHAMNSFAMGVRFQLNPWATRSWPSCCGAAAWPLGANPRANE